MLRSRIITSIALTVVASSIFSFDAFAHAHIKTALPPENSTVQAAPKVIDINFTEELETSMSKIEVKDLVSGQIVSDGAAIVGKEGKTSLQIALKPLKQKRAKLEVSWRAVSTDTHHMEGKYALTYEPPEH